MIIGSTGDDIFLDLRAYLTMSQTIDSNLNIGLYAKKSNSVSFYKIWWKIYRTPS